MKNALPLLVTVLLVLTAVVAVASQQVETSAQSAGNGNSWPTFTLDFQDSRYNPDSGINPSDVCHLQSAWNFSTRVASVSSQPIVANESVYFGDWFGNAYSLNLTTGALNWKVHVHSSSQISGTPAVVDGVVYVASLSPSTVYALNQTNGRQIWNATVSTNPQLAVWASPTVFRDRLYIGVAAAEGVPEPNITAKGYLVALNSTTGSVLWNFTTSIGTSPGNGAWGSVVVDPDSDTIYFGTGNPYGNTTSIQSSTPDLYSDSLVALNATNGNIVWYNQVVPADVHDDDFGATPNLFNYTSNGVQLAAVGLGSKGGYYYIFDRSNGSLLAKVEPTSPYVQSLGNAGFVGSGANTELFIPTYNSVSALFPKNLTKPWVVEGHKVVGSVALSQGLVFFGDEAGNLEALSMANGQELFGVKLPFGIWGGVTVASGYLLSGTYATAEQVNSTNRAEVGVYAYTLGPDTSTCSYPTLTTTTSKSVISSSTTVASVYSTDTLTSSLSTRQSLSTSSPLSSKTTQGAIPAFPYQFSAATIVAAVIVVSYLIFGRRPPSVHRR
jgi:outer membrane protein assembly factor BamB